MEDWKRSEYLQIFRNYPALDRASHQQPRKHAAAHFGRRGRQVRQFTYYISGLIYSEENKRFPSSVKV